MGVILYELWQTYHLPFVFSHRLSFTQFISRVAPLSYCWSLEISIEITDAISQNWFGTLQGDHQTQNIPNNTHANIYSEVIKEKSKPYRKRSTADLCGRDTVSIATWRPCSKRQTQRMALPLPLILKYWFKYRMYSDSIQWCFQGCSVNFHWVKVQIVSNHAKGRTCDWHTKPQICWDPCLENQTPSSQYFIPYKFIFMHFASAVHGFSLFYFMMSQTKKKPLWFEQIPTAPLVHL